MHIEARNYVATLATAEPITVIEIGSRNINGTIRDLFPNAIWTGLDLYPGPCVDVVADAEHWSPPASVDLVICCESFEHTRRWRQILAASALWLKPGGRMIITCAGPHRPPHSHHDGRRLRHGEFYANVSADQIRDAMAHNGMVEIEAHQIGHDTQATGRAPIRSLP